MLEDARPAAEVLSEYARACRQLGHSGPDPTALQAAYSAEAEMDLAALAADGRAVADLAAAADEALQLQEGACRAVDAAWQGAGGAVATEVLSGHGGSCAQTVDGLHCTAAALADLADSLQQLVAAKVSATLEIEARGARGEWLTAARTVTTGAGDQSGASELVDQRVAPFVAGDIGADWMSSMRATEDAVRQAYGAAAGAAAPPPVAMQPDPIPPSAAPLPAAPLPAGGFGGLPSAGSGLSGLSGLGQPVADLLGGLFDSAGTGSGSPAEDLDLDDPFTPEEDEPDDEEEVDESENEEEPDDEDQGEEEPVEPESDEGEDLEPPPPAEPAPTPAPEPVAPEAPPEAEPMAAPVTEPEPPATPCEIAADELPQAGA